MTACKKPTRRACVGRVRGHTAAVTSRQLLQLAAPLRAPPVRRPRLQTLLTYRAAIDKLLEGVRPLGEGEAV